MAKLSGIFTAALFFTYPFLVFWGIDKGMSWLSPVIVSGLFMQRAYVSKQTYSLIFNASLAILLLLGAFYVQTVTAKVLPILVQITLLVFFGRGLLHENEQTFIERVVRLQFPESPPAISHYCRQLTWLWTAFFACNVVIVAVLAIWGSAYWWAMYNGVLIYLCMMFLALGEYIYRRIHFADLSILHKGIPAPLDTVKSIFINGRKVFMEMKEQ